jgi:hypothetical protein
MEKPAKHTSPDWTEMYRLELGIDPSDKHQLMTAVTKDIVVARHGDTAARRRVAAYYRAQRGCDRQPEAEEREAAEHDEGDAADAN